MLMGDQKRRMDILVEKIEALGVAYEALRAIQKNQVIIINVLMKKMEVTDDEIKQETERLNALVKERQRNIKSGKI
jgi:hypothetical protein